MTVADLIAALQGMPQDAEVYVNDDNENAEEFYRPATARVLESRSVMHPHYPNGENVPVVVIE